MKIEQDKVVAVSYELEVEGNIADKATSERPLEYIHGTGMLLPRFEAELAGKQAGDGFEFILSPSEGYGEYNPKYKFEIPKSSFEVDGKVREDLLQVGRTRPLVNSAGQVVQGTVAAIGGQSVTMDFNHPMAGKRLHFTGKVESIRDATAKELEQGLHGEFLPSGEDGCGCGCGHDDCDCGHDDCGCGHGHDGHDGHGHCGHGKGGCCHHHDED